MHVTDMKHAINLSLKDMDKFSRVSPSFVFNLLENKSITDNTHEWGDQRVISVIHKPRENKRIKKSLLIKSC